MAVGRRQTPNNWESMDKEARGRWRMETNPRGDSVNTRLRPAFNVQVIQKNKIQPNGDSQIIGNMTNKKGLFSDFSQ